MELVGHDVSPRTLSGEGFRQELRGQVGVVADQATPVVHELGALHQRLGPSHLAGVDPISEPPVPLEVPLVALRQRVEAPRLPQPGTITGNSWTF